MSTNIQLIPLSPKDQDSLSQFLCAHPWPFHGGSQTRPEAVKKSFEQGYYLSDEVQSFWLNQSTEPWGFIRLFDLQDETPVFDLRLAPSQRGKGQGTQALRALCDYVFYTLEDKIRLEGHTRIDNLPMRRVFEKCFFVKEAHHRACWPDPVTGQVLDSIGYGLLRQDWVNQQASPLDWLT